MKKQLLTLFFGSSMLFTASVIAQPTLTATGTNPVIGNSFSLATTAYFSEGSAGANQTWNLSSLTPSGTSTSNCVAVSSTPNGSSFPAANIAFNNVSTSNYSYFKTSSSAYQNYGNVLSSGVVMSYSNPEDMLRFPFTYLNTYSDPWATSFVNGGYTFYRTGVTTITADAYGTLILPTGTISNVTRIHMVQNYQDSAFIGMPYVITYLNDEYLWYKDGTHSVLAACFTFTTNGGSPTQTGFYLNTPVGIEETEMSLSSVNLYPNPAAENVSFELELTDNTSVEVNFYDILGNQVMSPIKQSGTIGKNIVYVPVENLAEGVYVADILVGTNNRVSKRFVVKK